MKPVRLPTSHTAEDTDRNSFGVSPRFGYNMLSAGRHRRLSLDGEALGCLSVLVAGEHAERPHAVPSPGLAGELSASRVHAPSTVLIHRPRAVLSSPDNDELQGQQVEKFTSPSGALKPLRVCSHDQIASLSNDIPMPLRREVPKAVVSPVDELLCIGEREALTSDEASSCSTSSNRENNIGPTPTSNEGMDIKFARTLITEISNKKKTNVGLPPKSKHEERGHEKNLTSSISTNRSAKKHSGLPTDPSQRSSKQPVSPQLLKHSSVRVLRPWY